MWTLLDSWRTLKMTANFKRPETNCRGASRSQSSDAQLSRTKRNAWGSLTLIQAGSSAYTRLGPARLTLAIIFGLFQRSAFCGCHRWLAKSFQTDSTADFANFAAPYEMSTPKDCLAYYEDTWERMHGIVLEVKGAESPLTCLRTKKSMSSCALAPFAAPLTKNVSTNSLQYLLPPSYSPSAWTALLASVGWRSESECFRTSSRSVRLQRQAARKRG